ncbi:MAG: hypothetical protein KAR03_00650, partial [Candidatus Thorarchaeota archaeon]|nr:hypothetical protein [Candidatus Thorarchaeota archaeon]
INVHPRGMNSSLGKTCQIAKKRFVVICSPDFEPNLSMGFEEKVGNIGGIGTQSYTIYNEVRR